MLFSALVISASAPSSESVITARMTLSKKKEPMMTIRMQKMTAIQAGPVSYRLYIRLVHPSSVIIWNMVSTATTISSKCTMP